MDGKVCVVTGGTDGIGLVMAEELTRQGARVIIVSRLAEKGARAITAIRAATGREPAFIAADLSAQGEVRAAADELARSYAPIDVLINNAGALFTRPLRSREGIEMTFALNHLGYFLMTNLLLPVMAPGGRIVSTASAAHRGMELDFADLGGIARYSPRRAYGRSKLANIYFTYELARRLSGRPLTANCFHPGFVASAFGDETDGIFRVGLGLAKRFAAISPEKGADTGLYLATSGDVAPISGRYFVRRRPVESAPVSYDRRIAERLWDVSAQMVGLDP